MPDYWGAYDAEYDDGYRDVSSCQRCGNDCSGSLCSFCREQMFYDSSDGNTEKEWQRQKGEREAEFRKYYRRAHEARQEQLKHVCQENGRHWYIMGESACCVCGASKEQEKGDSNGS